MESELSGFFRVKLVAKHIVLGSPGTHFMHLKIKQEPASEKLLGKSLGKRYDPRYLLFGICPRMSHMSKQWYMYKVMYSNFSHCPAPVHSVLYTRFKFSSHQHYLDILVKTSCQEPHKAIFFFLFFFFGNSLHARLKSHYKAWNYKKKKHMEVKEYRKSVKKEPTVKRCLN